MTVVEIKKAKYAEYVKFREHYNTITTNIRFSGQGIKTVVVTSVKANEGKSTTSRNLAISLAESGFRTLLIDLDVRNSVMTGSFTVTQEVEGMTSFLSGNGRLRDIILGTNVANLSLIMAGRLSLNPLILIQGEIFQIMMQSLRESFDYIIVDTPPIGLVIDAAIIAQQADASILAVESGAIKKNDVKKAKEQMEQAEAQFLGVVLNKVDNRHMEYGYGYGYGYGSYGKQEERTEKKLNKKRV